MLATIQSPDSNESDVKLYHAVAATYTPSTATEGNTASAGFAIVLGFARAMTKLTSSEATPAGMTAALVAMSPEPMPLLADQTFQCNRKAAPITPGVCSNGGALVTLKSNGDVKSSESFNAGPYLNAG